MLRAGGKHVGAAGVFVFATGDLSPVIDGAGNGQDGRCIVFSLEAAQFAAAVPCKDEEAESVDIEAGLRLLVDEDRVLGEKGPQLIGL